MGQSEATGSRSGSFGTTRRIYLSLRRQILDGVYGPGDRLPSTRSLASELGVSRTTVTAVYEQLLAEGFLETRQGARATVARSLAHTAPTQDRSAASASRARLSAFSRRIAEMPGFVSRRHDAATVDFLYGDLSAADFPILLWRRALNRALMRRAERLAYADPRGTERLRAALQGYLWRARSLQCETHRIIVVNGSQQGLDLCARVLLDPGDRVVVEDPCYAMALQVFLAAGATPVPIAVDMEGLATGLLASAADVRLAYATPSHQFPLGSVMSAGQRRELLAWAERSGAFVIEDDYDSEYRYDVKPVLPLRSIDEADRVIYLGTVSKTLSPTLRLGYLVVPESLCDAFERAKRLTDRHTPTLEQDALADLIESGSYERHVWKCRRRNGDRRSALLAAMADRFGQRVAVVGAEAGLHVVAWFNGIPASREQDLVAASSNVGAIVHPVTPLYLDPAAASRPDKAGLVMGYASLDKRQIVHGVARLREAVDGLLSTS